VSPPPATSRELFGRLVRETDESAAVSLFVDLCRSSPALRQWLWEDFAGDPAQRAEFARQLKAGDRDIARFADLDGNGAAWREELKGLRARFATQTYGGLSFEQLKELIVRHQAGQGDAAAFLLALEWRRARASSRVSPRLMRAASDFLSAAMAPGGADLLRHLARAIDLTEAFDNRAGIRAALGFTDWWKLTVLLYMMRHPAASYRTRDLHRHLIGQGLNVSPRALRQFCTEHGIARDMRAGRPAPTPDAVSRPQRREGRPRSAKPRRP
jgi:hypothetical protein